MGPGRVKHHLQLLIGFFLALFGTCVYAELTIGNYSLESSSRVSRTDFEYTYRADLSNTGGAVTNATATLVATGSGTSIIQPNLTFGDVAAGATVTSSDTFTIRHNRSFTFDPNALVFTVSATPVVEEDTIPPQVSISSPQDGVELQEATVTVTGSATDDVALDNVKVNGTTATLSGNTFSADIALSEGANTLTAVATDTSGNTASVSINVTRTVVDTTPPTIAIGNPVDGTVVTESPVIISGTANDNDVLSGVSVNGVAATLNGANYSASVPLVAGDNTITATATDATGNTASVSIVVTLDPNAGDVTPPTVNINRPTVGSLLIESTPEIEISYGDDNGVDQNSVVFKANDATLEVSCTLNATSGKCTPTSALPEGDVNLAVSVKDFAGNIAEAQVDIMVDTVPIGIQITSPVDRLITKDELLTVTGIFGTGIVAVTVNGVDATLSGNAFEAEVTLREGTNMVVALARRANGKTGTHTVDITRDATPPRVSIDSPVDGFVTFNKLIAITGKVNDVVNGGTKARVWVNGTEATVENGTFMVTDLELVPGENQFTAIGLDAAGNQESDTITVVFQQVAGARLGIVDGNGQSALVNQSLDNPLVVDVRDDLGNPIAGRVVTFNVSRNSGFLMSEAGSPQRRSIQVPTDGSGKAQVLFTLGETTGEGNNRVTVTGQGLPGEIEFCASAIAGDADKILMVEGDNQRGLVGNPLDAPFEALVVDVEGNPITGAEVTFSVTKGTGSIDEQSQVMRITGTDGIARVIMTLGTDPGINNNIVTATTPGVTGLPATFVATGLAQGLPEETRFSGVVLDNTQTPIPGAVVTIDGAPESAITDEQGQFLIENVPAGHIHLNIDPTNSPRPETFPPLAFETIAVVGQNNVLGQPILIPAIDVEGIRVVGGDEDVVLNMPGVDGLSLKVFANSVTFADGSKVGEVSISQVHLDKVPMPPPSGTFFMPPAWTIQPAGTQFDPPAQITIPNDGLPPGRVIDIYQFDHSLNEFINVGKGTVSEDGAVITSDPGFGITRAGWGGCGQPPPPDTCADGCNDGDVCNGQESCENGSCVAGTPPPPETPRTPQSPGNCQTETCGGSEPNDGDLPENVPGDCQTPTCMDGAPGSEDDNSDVPEDISGDCQSPLCENGSPSSEDDNSDIPENVPGDCQAPLCENGAPSSEDDNSDIPENVVGDCQAPLCENGSPSSQPDNNDKPEDTAGDCQAPLCENGSPSSQPDNNDKPADTTGDCRAPVCQNGTPGDEPDDNDKPEDTAGDCRAPICLNGAPSDEPDDSDTPEDKCKLCENGAIKDVDTSTWKDDTSVAAEVKMPDNVKNKVEALVNRIPGLGNIEIKEVKAGVSGQVKDCCNPDTGIVPNGIQEGKGTGTLSVELSNQQLWPLPPTTISKSWIFESFGQVALVELDFMAGVFLDSGFSLGGAIGLRRNTCAEPDEFCLFGEAAAAISLKLSATVEAIACLELDTFLGSSKGCVGAAITPLAISGSINGGIHFNKAACGAGLGGSLVIGDIFFEASFSPGLPGTSTIGIKIKAIPGFTII